MHAVAYSCRFALGVFLWGVFSVCGSTHAGFWITAYYPGYRQSYLAASNIDFTVVTHVIHFSVMPNSDGTLDPALNAIIPARTADLVARAHAAGRAALICVGGAGSQPGFQAATSSLNRPVFISNILGFMSAYGYDGVDIDWEPLPASDFNQFTNFVKALRSALNESSSKLLTVAAPAYPVPGDPPAAEFAMFAALQGQLDQINIMTYDLSGAYQGWVTWFNAPIYDGGYRFPSNGRLVPSVNGAVSNFVSNGVASAKLGLGIPFYGKAWTNGAGTSTSGTLLPRQSWIGAPTVTALTYSQIMSNQYQASRYHWDAAAQAAYLSVTSSVPANDDFLSFDDEYSCRAKVSFARNHFLGGLMIWELGQGYFAGAPNGQRDPLLQTIKQALATPQLLSVAPTNQDIQFTFTTLPLAGYRVLWTSNLEPPAWKTFSNNVPGNGAPLQMLDSGARTAAPQRFYRVQTPP